MHCSHPAGDLVVFSVQEGVVLVGSAELRASSSSKGPRQSLRAEFRPHSLPRSETACY